MIVALTFDDGYLEHYRAARELYRADIPATFFLITGLNTYNGRKLLSAEPRLIRDIVDMGHEVGSHSHAHRDLTGLTPDEVEFECRSSKELLEDVTGRDVVGLAYPYGSFNNAVSNIVSRYYRYARTMGSYNRWNRDADIYAIGSLGVRHLPKLLLGAKPRLLVVTFHTDLHLVKPTILFLKLFNAKFATLSEALKHAGFLS